MRIAHTNARVRWTALVVAVGAVIASAGCAKKEVEPWVPGPRVQWEHISPVPVEPARDGFRILPAEPTRGLFPASISVTRVAIIDEADEAGMSRKRLLRDPRNEFLRWNSAFDDQMAISEVFPIAQRDLGGAEANPHQIIAAMHALHAQIGLVYGVNQLAEDEAEMFGALIETTSAEPIATIHASAVSIEVPKEARGPGPVDLWRTDARALVRERFEHLVHACVRELILQDQAAQVKAPVGWIPVGPIRPVEWPPRNPRTNW